MTHQRIVLAARPTGEPGTAHFRLETVDTPAVPDGHVLVRVHYLSLDPYMRMRMNDVKSYAAPVAVGEVMVGGTVGEIVSSRQDGFKPGDQVVCMGGWQEMAVLDARTPGMVRKLDTSLGVPLSAFLGPVGMPAPVVARIEAGLRTATTNQSIVERLGAQGISAWSGDAATLRSTLAADLQTWTRIIREGNIRAD